MIHSVIIIGSGPAAHTAALYLSRANLSPLLLEGDATGVGGIVSGGLLTTTKTVENYPGFPAGISGMELTDRFREQSLRFGTTILSETVVSVTPVTETGDGDESNRLFEIHTTTTVKEHKEPYRSRAVILATGSTPIGLTVPGYEKFWGNGISTCAVCDGSLACFRKVPIAVVGGGDSACEEALHLAQTASSVFLIHRRDTLRASKIMADRVLSNPKIIPFWNTEIREICGGDRVESLKLFNNKTNEVMELAVKGLFVAIGHKPNTEFLKGVVELNERGFIVTGRQQETSVKGIWAAGDVQDSHYRQAIVAAGSGCIAALEAERWL